MSDAASVMRGIKKMDGVGYPVLAPNLKGLEKAIECGVQEVAVFPAATEAFTKRNLNCGIEECLERFGEVTKRAVAEGIRVRGYVI